ncbi:hypothetical protein M5V91_10565 [Cytobacillus pseudoceanisediminis]|nr:hypothetical protein [Cytobacillus pseudoceanisediminis]UQX56024.1 hypothetical protein M5V91_10565 [Cytobacillus pseudoceanisediminis]
MKLVRDPSDSYVNMEPENGEWDFDIPVKKQPSVEYALDEEIEIEGVPVQLDKLILAPTATILQYGFKNEQQEKRIDIMNFKDMEISNKLVEADLYGSSYVHGQPDLKWSKLQAHFEPLFEKETKEVKIHFDSVNLSIDDQKSFKLDAGGKYPQSIEYAGSTISIDKVEIGQPTTVIFSNHDIKNRMYESLHFMIVTEEGNDSSMEMDQEGIFVDRNGKEYDMKNITPNLYEEMEQPRHFITVQKTKILGDNVIPKSLDFFGYSTTKYLEEEVQVKPELIIKDEAGTQ